MADPIAQSVARLTCAKNMASSRPIASRPTQPSFLSMGWQNEYLVDVGDNWNMCILLRYLIMLGY